ncbi:MAG: hypothetical protein ACRD1T_11375 [Acidimicrobiia bacterium]
MQRTGSAGGLRPNPLYGLTLNGTEEFPIRIFEKKGFLREGMAPSRLRISPNQLEVLVTGHSSRFRLKGRASNETSTCCRAPVEDEYRLFVVPVMVGGGARFLPNHVRWLSTSRGVFPSGIVHLGYGSGV